MKPIFTDCKTVEDCEAKISAILKDAPKYYGRDNTAWTTVKFLTDTHTALIWPPSIEAIVQEHECVPAMLADLPYLCRICGSVIEARWEKVK